MNTTALKELLRSIAKVSFALGVMPIVVAMAIHMIVLLQGGPGIEVVNMISTTANWVVICGVIHVLATLAVGMIEAWERGKAPE